MIPTECTCTGPARDAHEPGCPARLRNPRLDLGDLCPRCRLGDGVERVTGGYSLDRCCVACRIGKNLDGVRIAVVALDHIPAADVAGFTAKVTALLAQGGFGDVRFAFRDRRGITTTTQEPA
jgi:hypothetical protein